MKYKKRIFEYAMIALPVFAAAQTATPGSGAPAPILPLLSESGANQATKAPDAELGGTPCVDMITLGTDGPGTPLRFGGVLPRSERVTLNGIDLIAGKDYSMDYGTGVIYLQRTQRVGDSLSVSYRYSKKPGAATSMGLTGTNAMKFSLLPGAANLFMGLGMTERTADGKVLRSNVYGTQNLFSSGSASLKGAYFVGQRSQAAVEGGMNYDSGFKGGNAEGVTGDSKFMLQNFGVKVGGASLLANMQDVSSNFAGFGAVKDAGMSDAEIEMYKRERGLTRQGLGIADLKLAGMKFSANPSSVKDGSSALNWQNYGLIQKGFNFNVQNQRVETGFNRFNDIREADRAQLQKEQGLERSTMSAALEQKFGKLSFSSNSIEEFTSGRGLNRREAKLDTKSFGVVYGDQDVQEGFNRFGSLLGNEQALYGLEAGLHRQWVGFNSAIFGKTTKLDFNTSTLASSQGKFGAQTASLVTKSWSFDHIGKATDVSFNRSWSLSQPEQDKHIAEIAKMYGGNVQVRPEDRGTFVAGNGIGREFNGANVKTGKGSSLQLGTLNISGATGNASQQTANLVAKNFQITVRKLDIAETFTEGNRLMSFEKERLGTIPGLNRLDMSMNAQLGKARTFAFSNTSAQGANGQGFARSAVSYQAKGFEASFNQRSVDQNFVGMGQVADQERDLLSSLTGFSEKDAAVKWNLSKNLNLQYSMFEASNGFTKEDRERNLLAVDWKMDKTMQVAYFKQLEASRDPKSTLQGASTERISVNKQLGKTQVSLVDEKRDFDGRNNTQLDAHRQTVSVETQVTKNTSLKTEQTRTDFENGTNEKISSNTVSTKITKNVGVSVTDTNIDRDGDKSDQVKRDYGFWFDFGKGLRLSYGQQRNMFGTNDGNTSTSLAFGQDANRINADQTNTVRTGNVNGTNVSVASGSNSWDNQTGRVQSFSSFNLQTTKPFGLGYFGLRNISLNVAMDMASDNANWLRENQSGSMDGFVGKYAVGFSYRGQVDQQGNRAADRGFRFKTDPTGKQPWSATVQYKMRNLANGDQYAIRDVKLSYKPTKGLEVSNSVQTNPEQPNPNVILGSMPLADRRNEWKVSYLGNPNWTLSGLWQEQLNDASHGLSRTAGLNFGLFQKSGSPLNLFYGVEQSDGTTDRRTAQRWNVEFNQRPGPNQILSLFFGNLSYEGVQATANPSANNWTARFNYQLKF